MSVRGASTLSALALCVALSPPALSQVGSSAEPEPAVDPSIEALWLDAWGVPFAETHVVELVPLADGYTHQLQLVDDATQDVLGVGEVSSSFAIPVLTDHVWQMGADLAATGGWLELFVTAGVLVTPAGAFPFYGQLVVSAESSTGAPSTSLVPFLAPPSLDEAEAVAKDAALGEYELQFSNDILAGLVVPTDGASLQAWTSTHLPVVLDVTGEAVVLHDGGAPIESTTCGDDCMDAYLHAVGQCNSQFSSATAGCSWAQSIRVELCKALILPPLVQSCLNASWAVYLRCTAPQRSVLRRCLRDALDEFYTCAGANPDPFPF